MDNNDRDMYFSANAMNDMVNEYMDPVALEGIHICLIWSLLFS